MKKTILALLLSTIWVSASEYFRNELLLRAYWVQHYKTIGIVFPSDPIHGAMWGIWSFCLSVAIVAVSTRFRLWQTFFIVWLMGFVMAWMALWNLNVLPLAILPSAIPLSMLEVFFASLLAHKLIAKR